MPAPTARPFSPETFAKPGKGWPWTAAAMPVCEPGDWPRITVVTPSFQQGAFLEECVRSVLLQGYPNLEYLILDGGSTDNSREVLERYSPYLSYWRSEADGGQTRAINEGFARATGDILCWINSDDMLLPGALAAVARAFRDSDAEIVYGDALNLFQEDGSLKYWQGFWITRGALRFGGIVSSHAVFWKRSVHVPLWEELNCSMDQELWQRLFPGRRLKYLPLPLGLCRIHPESKSAHERWREKWRIDDGLIWDRHGKPSSSRLYRQWHAKSQRLFKAVSWLRGRKPRRAVIEALGWTSRTWRGKQP